MRDHATIPGNFVVLKVGTSSLVTDGKPDPVKVGRVVEVVCGGIRGGLSPVLVTSGAIAIGRARRGGLAGGGASQRAAAALGQGVLYSALRAGFAQHGRETGQILLTPPDLTNPDSGTDVRATFDTMRDLGVIPVVNENDALRVRNNDVLAAILAGYLRARLLLLLTDVPGLYEGNPLLGKGARRITRVVGPGPEVEALAGGPAGDAGTGGMRMKLGACWIATYAGVRTVISDTRDPDVLVAADRGDEVGTSFDPRPVNGVPPDLGRLWRAFRTPPNGSITCDPDGQRAVRRGEALLHNQITAVHGTFRAGDVVDLTTEDARPMARGSVRFDASTLETGRLAGAALLTSSDYVRIMEDHHVGD